MLLKQEKKQSLNMTEGKKTVWKTDAAREAFNEMCKMAGMEKINLENSIRSTVSAYERTALLIQVSTAHTDMKLMRIRRQLVLKYRRCLYRQILRRLLDNEKGKYETRKISKPFRNDFGGLCRTTVQGIA